MPKATLTFNLPEEREEYYLANNAGAMHSVLWDLDQWLREQIKYHDRNELQEVRDKLWELLKDENVNLG